MKAVAERARCIVSLFHLDVTNERMYGDQSRASARRIFDKRLGPHGRRNAERDAGKHVPSTLICPVATDQRARFDILRFVPWIDECERPKWAIVNIIVTNME